MLATGGAGALYVHTSNHPSCIGSGVAMASRAGARLLNLEFIQFHPTCLYVPGAPRFLITEALRGAGAHLVNTRGERFMTRYHPRPSWRRATSSRARSSTRCTAAAPSASTSTSRAGASSWRARFPTVSATCARYGIDIASERIPVVPAAHYTCGGIVSDLRGRATIPGLYVAGEVACTGVHGANRLASTSLLEGLTFGLTSGRDAVDRVTEYPLDDDLAAVIASWQPVPGPSNEDPALIAQDWSAIRHTMWNYVGIVRTRRASSEPWPTSATSSCASTSSTGRRRCRRRSSTSSTAAPPPA